MSDKGAGLDRIHRAGGCFARIAYGGFASLYLLGCLFSIYRDLASVWVVAVAAVANIAVVSRRRFTAWTIAAGVLSLLSTAYLGAASRPEFLAGVLAEIGALLILTARTAWRAERPRLVPMTVLLGAAILACPLRWSVVAAAAFTAPLGIALAVFLGVGLYLRALDARRARALAAARRDERLELARDLHDFVAHHVTGIVVQAQAARFAAQSGSAQSPEQLDRMFGGIETAGTEALTSMRRMVGLLRDAQNAGARDGEARPAALAADTGAAPGAGAGAGAERHPVGDLTRLRDLVAGFTHPPAALTLAPDLGTLPPEVAASAHRIVQEALTNVRKHAADAAAVRVTLARANGAVEVAVRDDGGGRGRRLPSGGFGLTGLAERVGALGGRLHAGPRPEGGWEVVAVLPAGDAKP
ncbi:sensor histidine kinase [Actinomadura sp. 7K534]|uniref:sensor histidine kinase n=1 Tax=Actinomadura sp. 7K534 TaxID=2530366 RepID=UPI001044A214|nr:sensor histidine kinase [Actinomadura sp. 7K534]TDB95125.1 two-component sensor histidine kinase [Actinomadura sp. 7K534]